MNDTITNAAKLLGISQGHLSNIKNGLRRPSPDVALRISQTTNTPIDIWLFKSEENLALREQAIKSIPNEDAALSSPSCWKIPNPKPNPEVF